MEFKYLITSEDGQHYLAKDYTSDEFHALCDGILTIIRLEDGYELNTDGEWGQLPEWGKW